MEELATKEAFCPVNLLALKTAFLSQSVQYIKSPNRVMLKGCLSISGEYKTILKRKIKENGIKFSVY